MTAMPSIEALAHGVTLMTLSEPAKPLIADTDTRRSLAAAFRMIGADSGCRVLVLALGSVGLAPPETTPASAAVAVEADVELARALLDLPMPVVAAVAGRIGAHAELALLADIIIVSGDAEFADDHWNDGGAPGGAAASLWQTVLRPSRAAALLMGLTTLTGDEGRRIGFVHEVTKAGELRDAALAHAARLAEQPGLALRFTRQTMVRRLRERLELDTPLGAALSRVARLGSQRWSAGASSAVAAE